MGWGKLGKSPGLKKWSRSAVVKMLWEISGADKGALSLTRCKINIKDDKGRGWLFKKFYFSHFPCDLAYPGNAVYWT